MKKAKKVTATKTRLATQTQDSATELESQRRIDQFKKRWREMIDDLNGMLDEPDARYIARHLTIFFRQLVFRADYDAVVGNLVVDIANIMIRGVMDLSKKPPQWLVERAPLEIEAPWFMIRGKPAPGFEEICERVKWGSKYGKKWKYGKSQVASQATHDVLYAWKDLEDWIACDEEDKINALGFYHPFGSGVPDRWGYFTVYKRAYHLQPLSPDNTNEWWDCIKALIRVKKRLSDKELENLNRGKDVRSRASGMSVYIKSCQDSFQVLTSNYFKASAQGPALNI